MSAFERNSTADGALFAERIYLERGAEAVGGARLLRLDVRRRLVAVDLLGARLPTPLARRGRTRYH